MENTKDNWLVKHHFWLSLLIGIGFLAVLQTGINTTFFSSFFRPFLKYSIWVATYSALVFLYNKKYLSVLNQYSFFKALRIPLLILAGAGAFLIITSPFLRGVFLLVSVGIIASFEGALAAYSENLLINEVLFTAFAAFCSTSAWAFLYAPHFSFYIALIVFAFIFLLSRSFFEYTLSSPKAKTISSLASALLIAELFWALSLLPQHYSVLSVALTATYYLILVTNYHYLFNNLDFKKIQFYFLFAALCIILVFFTTPWKILN